MTNPNDIGLSFPQFGRDRDPYTDQIEWEALQGEPVKQEKAVDYRGAGEVSIYSGVEVWRKRSMSMSMSKIEELGLSLAFRRDIENRNVAALQQWLKQAYELGREAERAELAAELTGGSSILRDQAAVVDNPAGEAWMEGD